MPMSAPVGNGERAQIISGIFAQRIGAEQLATGLTTTSCSTCCHRVVRIVWDAASDSMRGGPIIFGPSGANCEKSAPAAAPAGLERAEN